MIPVEVYILGELTFRGEVVGREFKAGIFNLRDIPKVGQVLALGQVLGGSISKWAGIYQVTQVDCKCVSGFGGLDVSIRVCDIP